MVLSTRGPRGGVSLAKPPEEIRLSEVIQLLEGSIAPVECINNPGVCSRSELCVTRDIWGEMKKAMNGVLESTTLQDLVERQRRKGYPEEVMYYI
jgi:Rrf2 family protein